MPWSEYSRIFNGSGLGEATKIAACAVCAVAHATVNLADLSANYLYFVHSFLVKIFMENV
jgi:hypothetical protein